MLITDCITIVTEGSTALGFGHIRRSITLARHIQSRAPVRLVIISPSSKIDPKIQSYLSGLNVETGPYSDNRSRLIILDLEPASMRAQLMRGTIKVKQLCLDLFDPSIIPTITINIIDHGGLMRKAYRNSGRENDYMEGPDFAIIRPSLLAYRPVAAFPVPKVRHVLITVGGADPAHRTLDALSDIANQNTRPEHITIIIGPLVPNDYEAKIRASAPQACRVLRSPVDYDAIIASADVVLCNGGCTLLESICLAKPTVVYPQTQAEENHAMSHARARSCVMAPMLAEVLRSEDLRNSLVKNAYRRLDGRGAERIAQTAINLFRTV